MRGMISIHKSSLCLFFFILLYTIMDNTATNGFVSNHKRFGRRSFIRRPAQKNQHVVSPSQLKTNAFKAQRKQPGSYSYQKAFGHYQNQAIQTIRYTLSEHYLPHPVSANDFAQLHFALGLAADKGKMPSFENAGARSGYALDFFCRARLLADLWFRQEGNVWKHEVNNPLLGPVKVHGKEEEPYQITSLAGGPAFDFVAAALMIDFYAGGHPRAHPMRTTVFDYEEGWEDLCKAMHQATQETLQHDNFICEWGGKCDITQPLTHPHNTGLKTLLQTTRIWTCQYVVAENAQILRDSNFVFFQNLFEEIPQGALVILTETTPRLWPCIYQLVQEECPYMQVGFVKLRGSQMILRKDVGVACGLSDVAQGQLSTFVEMNAQHERSMKTGFERQNRKVKGFVPGREAVSM